MSNDIEYAYGLRYGSVEEAEEDLADNAVVIIRQEARIRELEIQVEDLEVRLSQYEPSVSIIR